MAEELRRLGLDTVFGVEAFNPVPVFKMITKWGENGQLSTRQLLSAQFPIFSITILEYKASISPPRKTYCVVNSDDRSLGFRLDKSYLV